MVDPCLDLRYCLLPFQPPNSQLFGSFPIYVCFSESYRSFNLATNAHVSRPLTIISSYLKISSYLSEGVTRGHNSYLIFWQQASHQNSLLCFIPHYFYMFKQIGLSFFFLIFTCLHTLHFNSFPKTTFVFHIPHEFFSFPLHTIHPRHLAPSNGSKQTMLPVNLLNYILYVLRREIRFPQTLSSRLRRIRYVRN